jgi:predicted DNA-binding ribbon-helix-helix protein
LTLRAVTIKQARPRGKRAPGPAPMGLLRKRSLTLAGHGTSLALEPEFWTVLEAMAATRGVSLGRLIAGIDASRGASPLASACRVAALEAARRQAC